MRPGAIILLFASLVLLYSCKETTVSPREQGVNTTRPLIKLVDFDRIRLSDNNGVTRAANDLDSIGVGFVAGDSYDERLSFIPILAMVGNSYSVAFDTSLVIPESALTLTVRMRFYLGSNTSFDVDTLVTCYHFPYESTELVVAPEHMGYPGAVAQDMAFSKGMMYVLHLGDDRLFRREPGSPALQFHHSMRHSDFLGGDSSYIFIDNGAYLERFNTDLDTFDLRMRFIQPGVLGGVAAENGLVYLQYLYPWPSLVILDENGVVLDSINHQIQEFLCFHIEVVDGVVYGNAFAKHEIARFKPDTQAYLPRLKAPAKEHRRAGIPSGVSVLW
jgi:hypothetical protein